MNSLLAKPTAVLAVGGTDTDREQIRSAVRGGAATAVLDAADVDEARTTLTAREDVGCVVALDGDEAAFLDLDDAVSGVSEHLPVLAYVDDDPAVATAVARTGRRFLPRSVDDAALRDAVDGAMETYEERRQAAADSAMFRTLLDEGGLSMFAKDDQGRYVRMADVPYTPDPDDVRGKTDVEVFDHNPAVAAAATEDDLAVVETGEPIRGKRENFSQQGGEYWSESTKIPWRNSDGNVQGLVGFAIETTGRIQAERKLEKQRRRFDEFASYVSHDLRTPLQVSLGALELARDGDEKALDRIERANERIKEIIDDLSALSKGDRSDGTLSEEVLDVLEVGVESVDLVDVVESVWRVNETGDATLDVDVPEGTEVVTGTETLRPLVENLLKNAIDHGGPGVTVRVGTLDRGFYVEDDGPGISAAKRQKVLEKGYTTSEEGTGTGLAIVTETVNQQNWELTVTDSERGSGARFEVTDCPVVTPVTAVPAGAIELSERADVGDVSVPGRASYDEATDRWTVVGNGRDIWQEIDEFHFVYGDASNPVRVEGRLDAFEGVQEYSKAGLMVRDGLDDDAAFGFVGATESHGTETLWRAHRGEDAASNQFEEPYDVYQWYRIDLIGDEVTLSFSRDGDEWQALDQHRIDLDDSLAVGLAVCSHSEAETSEAVYDSVTVDELVVE